MAKFTPEELEELECNFTIIKSNSEVPAIGKNPLEERIIEIFHEMDFQVLKAKDLNDNTIYFLWDEQREKYYLSNSIEKNYLASELKKSGLNFKVQNGYCLINDLKVIDCLNSTSLEVLIDFLPYDYYEDHEINIDEIFKGENMDKFIEISKDLIKHYGLDNVANETEINALAYALQDCCAMHNEKSELSFTDQQIDDFKSYIVEYHIKGDNEPNNEQSVEDIAYSLHYSMLLSSAPEEIVDDVDRDLFINKVEMGIDGRYQVSFLCDDADSLLKRLKNCIMLGIELNKYIKFCIKNTDNFYELESLEDVFITEEIFNVKKHIENAPSNEVQDKELALKICSDLDAYYSFYEDAFSKICFDDIKTIKTLQNNDEREEFLKDLLSLSDNEFRIFEEAMEAYKKLSNKKSSNLLLNEILLNLSSLRQSNDSKEIGFIDSFFNDNNTVYSGKVMLNNSNVNVYIQSWKNKDGDLDDEDITEVLDKDFDFLEYAVAEIKGKVIDKILAVKIYEELNVIKNQLLN